MKRMIIVGGGNKAKIIINTITKLNEYEIIGYTENRDMGSLLGVKYLGTEDILADIIKVDKSCCAALGLEYNSVSNEPYRLFEKIKNLGYKLPVIISPNALVNEEVSVGEGTIILDFSIINVGSVIGNGVILNNGAIIEHDCKVGNFVHFSTGAIIGGGVEVGDNSIIGMGAKVIQYKKVGKNCLIEIGSIVIRDTLEEGIYFGVPAKRVEY